MQLLQTTTTLFFFLCWVGERLRYYLACKMYAYKGQSTSKGQSEHVFYHVMQLRHRVCLHLYRLQLPPSRCVSYTAGFLIICTGYNKQSLMLHCLHLWCVSSFFPSPSIHPLLLLLAMSQSADWLWWSGSHCLTWLMCESHASPDSFCCISW